MPREDRRIIFDNQEVYKAIFAICMQKQMQTPPAGILKGIRTGDDDKEIVILDVMTNKEAEESETKIEYKQDFIAAALMLYCRGLGIPLPKSAQKGVVIKDGEVMLRMVKD